MKHPPNGKTDGTGAVAPYDHLYIYRLDGRVAPASATGQKDLIGLWQETDCSFLFFKRPAPAAVSDLVRSQPHLTYLDCYHMTYDQWHGGEFQAFEQGSIRVVPAWQAHESGLENAPTARTVLLDPGVVFGVGTHPTTRDCLAALQHAHEHDPPPATALDLGTGTGLLALAAVQLGSTAVIAVDMNGLAAKTAQANVRLNRAQDSVVVIHGDALDLVHCSADLVIANIHYEVMRRLIRSTSFLAKHHFVLSGLMRSEARDIAAELSRRSITIVRQWQHEGTWFTFYARRRM